MNPMLLLFLAEIAAVQLPSIDPSRIEAELAADADVLRSLKENGDKPAIVRPVDVRFVGSAENIAMMQKAIGSMGWRVIQRVPVEADEEALDVQRDQTADQGAIRSLTEAALGLEAKFHVRYDGWGTVATQR